jgi:hypothetical protein
MEGREVLTESERRELLAWFMDMRLRGVHQDWIVIWCGANAGRLRQLLEFVKRDSCPWPNETHVEKPDYDTSGGLYRTSYNHGLLIWEELKKG